MSKSPCFGPQGLKFLGSTPEGQLLLSLGAELTDNLTHMNPLLLKGACQHGSVCGDDVKKVLLVSTAALWRVIELCTEFKQDSMAMALQVSQQLERYKVAAAEAHISELESPSERSPAMTTFRLQRASVATGLWDTEGLRATCLKLLTTSFGNAYSYLVRKRLKEMVMECLFPTKGQLSLTEMSEILTNCKHDLSSNYLFHAPLSVSETRVIPGFLLDKKFTPEPQCEVGQSLKTVLILSELDLEIVGAQISPCSQDGLRSVLSFSRCFRRKIVDHFTKEGIRLLLCGGPISPQWIQSLQESGIGAVQMVPEETLIAMAEVNGIYPSLSCVELVNDGIAPVTLVYRYISAGKKRYIHINTVSSKNSSGSPLSFLLCAPTTAHCGSLKRLLERAFKVIKNWFKSVNRRDELVSLLGRGVWEIELIREMKGYVTTNNLVRGSAEWVAVESLIQGFLTVPQTLFYNSVSSMKRHSQKSNGLFYHQVFNVSQQSLTGIDITSGGLINLEVDGAAATWPVLEPLWSQQHLLSVVCSLVSKVLRVDRIVPIPTPVCSTQEVSSEEGESDLSLN